MVDLQLAIVVVELPLASCQERKATANANQAEQQPSDMLRAGASLQQQTDAEGAQGGQRITTSLYQTGELACQTLVGGTQHQQA